MPIATDILSPFQLKKKNLLAHFIGQIQIKIALGLCAPWHIKPDSFPGLKVSGDLL
jgi:hypothetical protein